MYAEKNAISYEWPHRPLPPPPPKVYKSQIRGTLTLGLLYTSEGGGPPLKVYESLSTNADEALYYSTIYPNSCDLGTAE